MWVNVYAYSILSSLVMFAAYNLDLDSNSPDRDAESFDRPFDKCLLYPVSLLGQGLLQALWLQT